MDKPKKKPNGAGRDPIRAIRIPDDLWAAARERADREGVALSLVVREFLRGYAAGK